MSVGFPNLSWWLWSGKKKDAKLSNRSSKKGSIELKSLELDYPGASGGGTDSRRFRRKRRSKEEGKIDREHDSVVVPTDGGEFSSDSDSDSDGSDWSIGWSEPHAPGFLSEDEIDSGFGVLVRCYGRGKQDVDKKNADKKSHVPDFYVADNKKHMERWLSSLQGP